MMFSRWLLIAVLPCLGACAGNDVELRAAGVPSRAAVLAAERGLTDVRAFIPDIAVDLRYATSANIAGRALYPSDMPCLLKTSTAVKLRKAQALLRKKRLGLRIWDAWRPPEVQVLLAEKEGNTGLFLDPKSAWSRHCSGTAVDVTLIDRQGVEQRMPTYHDEGGERACYRYKGDDRTVRRNLSLLQHAMSDAGFTILDTEWWHFDDADTFTQSPPAPVVFGHEVGIHINAPQ